MWFLLCLVEERAEHVGPPIFQNQLPVVVRALGDFGFAAVLQARQRGFKGSDGVK
jgi:hypothetical protein